MVDTNFTLYYFPSSYYSQKALLVLYEKAIAFKEQIIYIHFGEQHENWYRRVNPNGVVPALQDGDKMIVESEEIINYVDKACPCASRLVPDLETKLGQEVRKYRQILDSVKVPQITFGVLKNSNLSTRGLQIPAAMQKQFNKQKIEKKMRDDAAALQRKVDNAKTEEDRKYFEQKVTDMERRSDVTSDADRVAQVLDETEAIFDELEQELQRMKQNATRQAAILDLIIIPDDMSYMDAGVLSIPKTSVTTKQRSSTGDYWLCGTSFTAADITATTLILRFQMLGIDDRYFNSKRPWCCEYRDRLLARPSTKKLIETSDRTPALLRNKMIKTVAKRVMKAGLVVGLVGAGIFVYRKYFR